MATFKLPLDPSERAQFISDIIGLTALVIAIIIIFT